MQDQNKIKKGLFFFLALIILLPFIQYNTNVIMSIGLVTDSFARDVSFTPDKWLDGSYQKQKTQYMNDTFGFRPDFVRLNNQVDFWLFHTLHTPFRLHLGDDNVLFDQGYTEAYFGTDYIGDSALRSIAYKLKRVQDTLERLGKTFVYSIGPLKPCYYPDGMPAYMRFRGTGRSNYSVFVRLCDSMNIHKVDFNVALKKVSDTDHYSIFGKRAAHWSTYASLVAADSMVRYLEAARHIKMPQLKITALHHTDGFRDGEENQAARANLIFPLKKEPETYADYHFEQTDSSRKPNAIYIGDSFCWFWVVDGLMNNTNSYWEFWDYFDEVITRKTLNGDEPASHIAGRDWHKTLQETDCVVVMFTAFNIKRFGGREFFVQAMYDYYYPAN